jgi:hypothetical protein
VLEQISFEEVSPRSVEQSYHSHISKDQTKSLSMASNNKEDYEWQLLIVRKAVSNPHLVEQGAGGGPMNTTQLKSSKSDSNQPAESGFDQPNWSSQQKKQIAKRKHKRVRSNEKVPGPPTLSEASKKWNSSAQLESHETAESSDSDEVLDNVTIIKVRRTQSSGVLAVTHRRHQSAPRQMGVSKYRRLTDPGCDVHTEDDEHVTDARTGQGLDDGVNLSDPISLAAQPRLIRVTNRAKKKTRHATQQVQKRKSRDADDDKSSSGSHYGSSDSDHERTLWELDDSAPQNSKSELSHAALYSKHIEPILRHTQQLMSTLHLDDDDQDEIEITKFTVGHGEHQHEHAVNHSMNDEERCPAPDPIAMLCGDMLSNPDSPISPSTSDDEYEELDRAPTVNMTRAPPRASKSNLLLTRSRAKLSSEHSQSSLSVNTNTNTNESSAAPGTRPQLHVNLASIHEHREASVSQGNFFLNTDRRTFTTSTATRQQMYTTSKSLPKFHVKPVEPDHGVMNVPQPVAVTGAVQVSQSVTSPTTEQSPRQIKYTMSTPYLSSAQRLLPHPASGPHPHVHNNNNNSGSSGGGGYTGPTLTMHHSLASLTHPAVIPSPRRSAFVTPARLTTPRPSLTDVHNYTSPSVPVNSNPNIVINTAMSSNTSDTVSNS